MLVNSCQSFQCRSPTVFWFSTETCKSVLENQEVRNVLLSLGREWETPKSITAEKGKSIYAGEGGRGDRNYEGIS